MPRTKQNIANIPALKKLIINNGVMDNRPLIAVVMRECGCTMQEIADVMEFSRQMAETMVKNAQITIEELKAQTYEN